MGLKSIVCRIGNLGFGDLAIWALGCMDIWGMDAWAQGERGGIGAQGHWSMGA